MKVQVQEVENEGLVSLLGERVLLMCAAYFYVGTLVGVNDTCVKLAAPAIVYDTGNWSNDGYSDEQSMGSEYHYVQTSAIESFGPSK